MASGYLRKDRLKLSRGEAMEERRKKKTEKEEGE